MYKNIENMKINVCRQNRICLYLRIKEIKSDQNRQIPESQNLETLILIVILIVFIAEKPLSETCTGLTLM